jgi:hypothetical protein
VSVQLFDVRRADVVLAGEGAAAPSKHVAVAPYPTISTINGLAGQAPESATMLPTRATLPAVADMFTPVFDTFVVGKGEPIAPLVPSPTR